MTSPRAAAEREAWRASYVTTDSLQIRLDTLRRYHRPRGVFGLDVLSRDDADGRSVLEIGPGTGTHATRFLERTGARPRAWTLLDRSAAMVRTAHSAIAPLAATRGVVGDAERLPIARGARFDLIVAMHVLPFCRAPRRVLAALAARLATHGRLLVTTTATGDTAATRRVLRSVLRARGLPWRDVATLPYASATAERQLRGLFADVLVHPQAGDLEFPDAAPAARYIGSMPWLADAPADARAAVEEAIFAQAARDIARDGVHRMPKPSATFVAWGPRE